MAKKWVRISIQNDSGINYMRIKNLDLCQMSHVSLMRKDKTIFKYFSTSCFKSVVNLLVPTSHPDAYGHYEHIDKRPH